MAFSNSDRNITGFPGTKSHSARKVQPGDKFVCYMTKLKRWIGILEVVSPCFFDDAPLFVQGDDPFTVRFQVRVLAWLEPDKAIPMIDDVCWRHLSFTKDKDKSSLTWTNKVRSSLNKYSDADGAYLEDLLTRQMREHHEYPLSATERRRLSLNGGSGMETGGADADETGAGMGEHARMQAKLAHIGECMNMRIWIPVADRRRVLREWHPSHEGILLETLPIHYDERTIRIIENIDVIWVRGHAIERAFEVEHTTSIYSGILRMADLAALQPNMSIDAHIVAPNSRRSKVLREIGRPAFALMGNRRSLPDFCSYLSYDAVTRLSNEPNLRYLSSNVIREYAEYSSDFRF